jgi:hypothetical protein
VSQRRGEADLARHVPSSCSPKVDSWRGAGQFLFQNEIFRSWPMLMICVSSCERAIVLMPPILWV